MTRWVVVAPFQVNHEGVVYGPGETFEADDKAVDLFVRSGWVRPAKARHSTKRP